MGMVSGDEGRHKPEELEYIDMRLKRKDESRPPDEAVLGCCKAVCVCAHME